MSKRFVKPPRVVKKKKANIIFNLFSFCPLEDADFNCFISIRCYRHPTEEFFGWAYTIKSKGEVVKQERSKVIFHEGISDFSLTYTAISRIFDYFISENLVEARVNLFGEVPLVFDQMSGNIKINPKAYCSDLAWEIQDKLMEFYNLRLNFITRTANIDNHDYLYELT